MLSTKYYLHLAFEYEHDMHYTDSLLRLDGDTYLWYVLRCYCHFDVISFVKRTQKDIRIQIFDSISEQVMCQQRGGTLGLIKLQRPLQPRKILRKEFSLQDLNVSEWNFFQWAQERVRDRRMKNRTFAFVVTLDALETLYKNCTESDRHALCNRIEQPDGRSILVCQISPQPGKLTEAFLKPDALLPKISQQVAAAVSGQKEALADALDRQMDGQILKMHVLNDVYNMLLFQTIINGDYFETSQNIKDQAEYLQKSINRYGRWLAEKPEIVSAVKHREVFEKMNDPQFRADLRIQVHQLRQKYPGIPVGDAMEVASTLDTPSWISDYDDPLTRNIQGIKLPEEEKWQNQLMRIKKNFRILWNKPRNALVCKWTTHFYQKICEASVMQNWETAWDALQILDFCSEQICADINQEETLAFIFENGKAMIDLAHNISRKDSRYGMPDRDSHLEGRYEMQLRQEERIVHKIAHARGQEDLMNLYFLRSALYASMEEFSKRQVSDKILKQIFQDKVLSLRRQVDESIQTEQKKCVPEHDFQTDPDGFDQTDYLLSQSQISQTPYSQQQRKQDQLAGEKLLHNTVFS